MILLLWLLIIFAVIVIIGETRYQTHMKRDIKKKESFFNVYNIDTSEVDMDNLNLEYNGGDFASRWRLSMRGSWRLAQNKGIDLKTFHSLEIEEYRKKL